MNLIIQYLSVFVQRARRGQTHSRSIIILTTQVPMYYIIVIIIISYIHTSTRIII